MCSDNNEKLFLLEILVEDVNISISSLNLETKANLKQTCVKFQFLHYPDLEICEEDFALQKSKGDSSNVSFKGGKSCLFALRGHQTQFFRTPFNIDVTVFKSVTNRPCITVGKTCVELGDILCNLVNSSKVATKTIKETYVLQNQRCCKVGTISLFIRLSCFGKYIITKFQLGGLENKSFLFKADQDYLEEENATRLDKVLTNKGGEIPYKQNSQNLDIFPQSFPSPTQTYNPCLINQHFMNPVVPGISGSYFPENAYASYVGNIPNPMLIRGDDREYSVDTEESEYKELTASINGRELSIKILRKQRVPKSFISNKSSLSSCMKDKNKCNKKLHEIKKAFCECEVPHPLDCDNEGEKISPVRSKNVSPDKKNTSRSLYDQGYSSISRSGTVHSLKKRKKHRNFNSPKQISAVEEYLVKLGNCPMPINRYVQKSKSSFDLITQPCTTQRDTQYENEDMLLAIKLEDSVKRLEKQDKKETSKRNEKKERKQKKTKSKKKK